MHKTGKIRFKYGFDTALVPSCHEDTTVKDLSEQGNVVSLHLTTFTVNTLVSV
jgi:hypothetical protein